MRIVDPTTVDEPTLDGGDWPMPAERPPMTPRERWLQATPAIVVSVLLHVGMLFWLLDDVEPWKRAKTIGPAAPAIEVFYFDPTPPPPATPDVVEMEVMRVYAVPFPMSAPTQVESAVPVREPTTTTTEVTLPERRVDAGKLFGDIGGIAGDMSPIAPGKTPRSNTRLPGSAVPFSDAEFKLQPPPPSPQKYAQKVIRMLMSTRGANNITDFMGATEGREPGREISRGHHDGLYLPRDCDNPDNPNTSDECMGIPKR